MSEGENKFLKLAWNTSQEKPSVSQIVMKQTLEQSVIAGEGEAGSPAWHYLPQGGTAAAQPGATYHGVGQQSPYRRISPSGKYTLSPPNRHASTPRVLCGCHFSCHRGVTVFTVDLEETGRKDSSLVNSIFPEGSWWAMRARKVV